VAVLEIITMALHPEKDITKILLSTPSYLVGNYEENGFLLSEWLEEMFATIDE
jgi:hypothetical protein